MVKRDLLHRLVLHGRWGVHVYGESWTALSRNWVPRAILHNVKMGFHIIFRDSPINSRLRDATENMAPDTWPVLACRLF